MLGKACMWLHSCLCTHHCREQLVEVCDVVGVLSHGGQLRVLVYQSVQLVMEEVGQLVTLQGGWGGVAWGSEHSQEAVKYMGLLH
jgi:hypothetical protein